MDPVDGLQLAVALNPDDELVVLLLLLPGPFVAKMPPGLRYTVDVFFVWLRAFSISDFGFEGLPHDES